MGELKSVEWKEARAREVASADHMLSYDFDQNEVVLALQSVTLESESMTGGHREFIAVGTGFDFAEDRATRGNVSPCV